MADATRDTADVVAWRSFCERMAGLGERILGEGFPSSERERVEGYRHLAEQLVCWLGWSVGYDDPAFPFFYRNNDRVTKWGGPNVDNAYRQARVNPDGTYRITGRMNACEDFILDTRDGHMHMERYGVFAEVTASELGIRAGDAFELILSRTRQPGNWVELDPRTELVNVREYYLDWRPAEPATFVIERLDTLGTVPAPPTVDGVAAMLTSAADQIEGSIVYWNDYMRRGPAVTALPPNTLSEPQQVPGGAHNIFYGGGLYRLGDDEALVIDCDVPDARSWSFQLYPMGWFESGDFANRVTSINGAQAALGPDGRFWAVIAHEDPGVVNWLDTEGRQEAMVTYRWIWSSTRPAAHARLVKLAELDRHLPDGVPRCDPEQRREQIRQRQAHVAWRFRT